MIVGDTLCCIDTRDRPRKCSISMLNLRDPQAKWYAWKPTRTSFRANLKCFESLKTIRKLIAINSTDVLLLGSTRSRPLDYIVQADTKGRRVKKEYDLSQKIPIISKTLGLN